MKYCLILIISIFLLASNQNPGSNNKFLQDLSPTDNKKIFGQWQMCSTLEDGMMIQANVCATFNFAANGLGFITHAQKHMKHSNGL
jgi:hypothetical protein